jgi:copper chaperone
MKFQVPDLSCGHCADAVTRAVQRVAPDAVVAVDIARRIVTIEGPVAAAAAAAAMAAENYRARLLDEAPPAAAPQRSCCGSGLGVLDR